MEKEQLQMLIKFIKVIKKSDKKQEFLKSICRSSYRNTQ